MSLLHAGIPLDEKLLRTVAVYAGLAAVLRLAGKRDLAQLNSFDLVVVLLLGNVVQNAVIGPDDSLTGALEGVVALVALNAVVVRLVARYPWAVRVFEGADTALVRDGVVVTAALRREGLRRADVEAALRVQNAGDASEVAEATLTPGGAIVVWLKPEHQAARRRDVEALHRRLDDVVAGLASIQAQRGP